VNEAAAFISDKVDMEANIIWGAVHDESMGDSVSITIIATGVTSRKDVGGLPLPTRRAAPVQQQREAAAAAAAAPQPAAAASSSAERVGSPNPFMAGLSGGGNSSQAPAAGKQGGTPQAKPAAGGRADGGGSSFGGGIEVPAFLRNLHKPKGK
jgi:cell division protein FtsZ